MTTMKSMLKRFVPMRLLYTGARVYWFFRRPSTRGVKVVVWKGDTVLLVRHTYQPDWWTFPGGGIKKGESAEDTLQREIKEEVGINLGKIIYAGEFKNNQDYKDDTVVVYTAQVNDASVCRDQLEILEARWFPIREMPQLPPNAQRIFDIGKSQLKW